MKVLVDTCIWSHALRYKNPRKDISARLTDLIRDGRAVMIGPIRQELLSGISDRTQFQIISDKLSAFDDIPLTSEHFIKAAEFSNLCRSKGVQGSTTDFLICAVAHTNSLMIFTTDNDFKNYAKHLPIRLF
jgi:predicted nucleic acid-binding protein